MSLFGRRRGESEATKARKRAEVALAATRAQTPTYQTLGDSLRELRERNHYGDAIANTFRGGKR